ncbi:Thiol-disulfide oxidoreductase ResA [compost metagenome]
MLRSIPAGTKAGEAAGPVLFELENLQVGHKAPDVVGTDLDGKEIRLSQFLGQVVILDYWGFM